MSETYSLFDRLILISVEAFEEGLFDTSFHSLKAALHYAQRKSDAVGLLAVGRIAEQQLRWIDEFAPHYEHSTAAATARNATSIFKLLEQQAETLGKLVQDRSEAN